MRRWLLIPLFFVAWAGAARAAEPGAGGGVLTPKFYQASARQAQAPALP